MRNSIKGLQDFIKVLENCGELIRIKEYVNPELEITEIVDRISKQPGGGKALLFENTGTNYPLLINAFGSEKRICLALGINELDDISRRFNSIIKSFNPVALNIIDKLNLLRKIKVLSKVIPKYKSGKGLCQRIIINKPDLSKLPILKCWPYDGGKFITLPLVHTIDPIRKIRNVGMYRMQVLSANETGMHWHRHKGGANHFIEYQKLGLKMPVAIVLGGDPIYTYAATAPLPENIDEYLFAGFIRNKSVELVKCITQDIYVPNDADFVIEGFIDPTEDFIIEGPFGDHTGFYSLYDKYPKFHITSITHKKNAVYPATIVGIPPMEDAWIAKATERIFIAPIKITVAPEIIDMIIPVQGVAHNLAIIKINKKYPGQAYKVANLLWGAGQMMFNKIMVIVDQKCNINGTNIFINNLFNNVLPERDFYFSKGPLDVLDHSTITNSFGSKLCIDATDKYPEETNQINKIYRTINNDGKIEKKLKCAINSDLINCNIPVLIFAIYEADFNVNEICKLSTEAVNVNNECKHILVVDFDFPINDIYLTLWFLLGNLDPSRDIIFIEYNEQKFVIYDGTSKYMRMNNKNKKWPNVIISDDNTINTIDEQWNKLGLGQFIESPSKKLKKIIKNKGAEVT